MYVNKAIIIGNLTRDPELKQLPSGSNVCNMGVATNRVYKNQQGEKVEEVEYHNVVLFGRIAEVAGQYLKKGSSVYIEGRLRTSSWEADGVKKYKTEIIGDSMQLGPRRNGGGDSPAGSQPSDASPEEEINPDDIPF